MITTIQLVSRGTTLRVGITIKYSKEDIILIIHDMYTRTLEQQLPLTAQSTLTECKSLQLFIEAAESYSAYRTPRDNLPHVRPQAILNPFRTQLSEVHTEVQSVQIRTVISIILRSRVVVSKYVIVYIH